MGYQTLLVEREGPILWVRLNRPAVLNAYTGELGADPARSARKWRGRRGEGTGRGQGAAGRSWAYTRRDTPEFATRPGDT